MAWMRVAGSGLQVGYIVLEKVAHGGVQEAGSGCTGAEPLRKTLL